jgi:hypothetical protein
MTGRNLAGLVFVGLGLIGCSASITAPNGTADPAGSEALRAHWEALQRRDWKVAYAGLHPSLKTRAFGLRKFTDIHAKRPRDSRFPLDIRITGSEQAGDDIVVSFDLRVVSEGAGEPVASPLRHKVTLKKSGERWGLMTSDILAQYGHHR